MDRKQRGDSATMSQAYWNVKTFIEVNNEKLK